MSYQHMDHAGWFEKANHVALTAFQARVIDIVGMVGGGIYNAPIAKRVDLAYGHDGVAVIWKDCLASFDSAKLTMLVLLCHEARIRCQIESAGPRMMRIAFWQRGHEGGTPQRHPNLDEAVAAFRAYLPADHRIIYRAGNPAPDPDDESTRMAVSGR